LKDTFFVHLGIDFGQTGDNFSGVQAEETTETGSG
jgi:hypothetical protein